MITIIFDIDGTLTDSMENDTKLFVETVKNIIGDVFIHDDWGNYPDVTNSGILNQLICENNIPNAQNVFLRVHRCFGEKIMVSAASKPYKPIRGAVDAINELYSNKNYIVGFATGGWKHTALLKLKSAGFSIDETTLFSSDDHFNRMHIMNLCKKHISTDSKNIVYVGDAEWDVQAATALQWGFIGVGNRLKGKTDVWIEDFRSGDWKSAPERALRLAGIKKIAEI
ncbi:MAG: HAD family hydrolase [Candidatus Latescibacteria bacterium]|nr:HAD family hydrolase [Candidatus Latescibacterota bacterium]